MKRETDFNLGKLGITRVGDPFYCLLERAPELEAQQRLTQLVDINKRLHQENDEIRQMLQEEREIGQKRAQIMLMVVHEIISPLNVISMATSLLKRRCDRWTLEKKQQYLIRIQTAIEQLTQLMEAMLLLGRIDGKKITVETQLLELELLCRNLVAQIRLEDSARHQINFLNRCDRTLVSLDCKLLQPILTNLLANAIKYSPEGSAINLIVTCTDEAVIFQIQDRGIGIPAGDREKLFESFYRGENVGNIPGSGLGLTIVAKLVELQNGSIEVDSKVGLGTTFTVSLPLKETM
jgi:signal transduction histidine kinase